MLNVDMVDRRQFKLVGYGFPLDHPTGEDFKLWNKAVHSIIQNGNILTLDVGDYVYPTHRSMDWMINQNKTKIYCIYNCLHKRD